MARIASSIPGRVRIRDAALRDRERLRALEAGVGALAGVGAMRANAGAGSLVVHYDAAALAVEVFERRVDALVDEVIAASRRRAARSPGARANRAAKIGMLGSLGVSLAFAAAGAKRWHVLSGGVFLACLAVHVGLRRHALLR